MKSPLSPSEGLGVFALYAALAMAIGFILLDVRAA
jgi:hypothetical protein